MESHIYSKKHSQSGEPQFFLKESLTRWKITTSITRSIYWFEEPHTKWKTTLFKGRSTRRVEGCNVYWKRHPLGGKLQHSLQKTLTKWKTTTFIGRNTHRVESCYIFLNNHSPGEKPQYLLQEAFTMWKTITLIRRITHQVESHKHRCWWLARAWGGGRGRCGLSGRRAGLEPAAHRLTPARHMWRTALSVSVPVLTVPSQALSIWCRHPLFAKRQTGSLARGRQVRRAPGRWQGARPATLREQANVKAEAECAIVGILHS